MLSPLILSSGCSAPPAAPVISPQSPFEIKGQGDAVSETFLLPPGEYRIRWVKSEPGFIQIDVRNETEGFYQIAAGPMADPAHVAGEQLGSAPGGGRFHVEVDTNPEIAWEVEIRPIP